MKTRIIALILVTVMLSGCFACLTVTARDLGEYPELVITEIACDTYGDTANPKNTNAAYGGNNAAKDVFEFIELYNNSDKTVNIFDYMLAYQGAGSDDAEYFESSVQEYTPFFPGEDWTDAPYTAHNKYWTNSKVARPVNPAYDGGKIAPGEVAVVWMYNEFSHSVNGTVEQFRKFWSIPDGVKVFLLDADAADDEMNFNIKNSKTGSYMIMHSSERFPERRSADSKFYCESDNTHHNYFGKTYGELEEIINWAVIDYKTEPLKSYSASNGNDNMKTNFTISYIPETDSSAESNGYKASSFASAKRSHLEKINSYAEATVGKLNDLQKTAFAKTVTTVVRTQATNTVKTEPINNTERPDLCITKISPDQYGGAAGNVCPGYSKSSTSDPFEFIELYNNADHAVNIYDYMMGYQGSSAASVSTYFERLIQEYTAIFPGEDWIDAPYTEYDSYWKGISVERPSNPGYAQGVINPGEFCVLWFYSADSHKAHATVSDFRSFWMVPENVKVFLVDANSSLDKNFNIKNSATGTYVVMKPSSRMPQRRSDDTTLYTEDAARFWSLQKTYIDVPEVVSWAVVDFGSYDPLYTYSSNDSNTSFRTNYTIQYAPYEAGKTGFENGFLTTSIVTGKRMHFSAVNTDYAKTGIATLTPAQQSAFANAIKK